MPFRLQLQNTTVECDSPEELETMLEMAHPRPQAVAVETNISRRHRLPIALPAPSSSSSKPSSNGFTATRQALMDLNIAQYEVWMQASEKGRVGGTRQVLEPTLFVSPSISITLPSGAVVSTETVKVFTRTTKMLCGSFSLPAGSPSVGGTCGAASANKRDNNDGRWICDGCYATEGNYMYPIVQLTQRVRLEWVKRTLASRSFRNEFISALKSFLAAPRYTQIDGKQIPISPRYFRVHDSGDFSGLGMQYLDDWLDIAKMMPDVRFWAPTRDWIFPEYAERMAAAPRNFLIRPSALYTDTDAPKVKGLPGGASVSNDTKFASWDCPASRKEANSCSQASGLDGNQGCRTCWERHDVSVNYRPHRPLSALMQIRTKRNQAVDDPSAKERKQLPAGQIRRQVRDWRPGEQITLVQMVKNVLIETAEPLGMEDILHRCIEKYTSRAYPSSVRTTICVMHGKGQILGTGEVRGKKYYLPPEDP